MSDSKGFPKSIMTTLAWITCAIVTACAIIYLENIGMDGMGGPLVGGLMASLHFSIRSVRNNETSVTKSWGGRALLLVLIIALFVVIFINHWRMNYLATILAAVLGYALGLVIMEFIYKHKNTD